MKKMAGVTLLELLIVIVIVGITLTYGVPGFQTFIANSRISGQTNTLIGTLMFARSEAIKRNQSVDVNSGGDWSTGWQVLADTDGDGTGDLLLQSVEALTGGSSVASTSNIVTFDTSGRAATGGATLTMTTPHASSNKVINLNALGRVLPP